MRWSVRVLLIVTVSLLPSVKAAAQDLPGFIRGDINGDLSIDLSDPILLLEELFGASQGLDCQAAADLDADGQLQLDDVIVSLGHIFLANPAQLPAPFPDCGTDENSGALPCEIPPCVIGPIVAKRQLTLASFRETLPYFDQLPAVFEPEISWQTGNLSGIYRAEVPFISYGVVPGEVLPGDLLLDPQSGRLSATQFSPGLHQTRLWALDSQGGVTIFNCRWAAFDDLESSIIPGQSQTVPGPYIAQVITGLVDFTHDLPWPTPYPLWGCSATVPSQAMQTDFKALRIFIPQGITGPAPLVIFHHGTGFNWEQYDSILGFLSTHGIICVSINDPFSFDVYTDWYCWGGHDEAAKVMVHVRGVIEELSMTPGTVLEGLVDSNRVFYSGHSRGGGAAVAAAEIDPDVRGLILLQPTDAKQDSWIGNTSRWQILPDIPLISVTAEQDTDVIYPYAERLMERMVGPSTSVCIYGGCHGYSSDDQLIGCNVCTWQPTAPQIDSCAYITRSLQHELTRHWVWTFLRRHAFGDLSLEGLLYGNESQTSPYFSVAHNRDLSGALLVDNFDLFPRNNLGHLISSVNTLLFTQGACYDWPFPLPQPLPTITNLVTILPPTGTATVSMPLGSVGFPLDVGPRKALQFRIKNHDVHGAVDNSGWFFDATLSLIDAAGRTATVDLNQFLPQTPQHPQPDPAGLAVTLKYQRFISVEISLERFLEAQPLLDTSQLVLLEWQFTTDGTAAIDIRFGLDDILFR
ncbi:MAG: hypothetical protein DSY81_03295 [Bacillota bacterium]|nr:MAG: hypothetical protein DSY92_03290 [Planctomycetota bacterium]RUA10514.1 MAG: hypothetical protein DSY81_03295 [Bacillota bacterium]